MKKLLSSLMLFICLSCSTTSQHILENNKLILKKEQTIYITGPILNYIPQQGISTQLDKTIQQISTIYSAGHTNINLIIDSPGGILDKNAWVFMAVLDWLKTQDITVTCIVDGQAASLAMAIYTHCHSRFATVKSVLMWHSIIIMGDLKLNEFSLEDKYWEIKKLNERLWSPLKNYMSTWYFMKHFKRETLIPASHLERNTYGFMSTILDYEIK